MSQFYDQVYQVQAWINIETNKQADQLLVEFQKMGAYNQVWPTDTVENTIKAMANQGWWQLINSKEFPRFATEEFAETLLRRHMSTIAGDNVFSMPSQPYSQVLDRKITSPESFRRIFDDCLSLEEPITLSRMFGLAQPKSKLYITHDGNTEAIRKISKFVLTVGDKTSMVSVGKKRLEDIVAEIEAALPKFLKES